MRAVLRFSQYRRLLAAYALTELAWGVASVALAILVYRRTGSAAGAMAYFLAAQFVPAVLSPWLVARLDRSPPQAVLGGLYGAGAALFAALAWLSGHFALAPVLAVTVLAGVLVLTAGPIARAVNIAVTEPAGLLREANALLNTAFAVGFMAGPALGGVVVAVGGTRPALVLDAIGFAVIALTLGIGALPAASSSEAAEHGGRLRAGLRYASTRPLLRGLLVLQGIGVVFFTVSLPVDLVFVEHTLHRGAGSYGALLAVWGGGAILGSAVYARWRRWSGRSQMAVGATALGAGFFIMAAAPTLAVALLGTVVGGAGNGIWVVAARTTVQEELDGEWRAIVLSLNESILQASPGAGIALGGALTAVTDARIALAIAGAGTVAVTLATLVVLGPSFAAARR